jgi:DNA-binding transcriptional regulator YhcF (GntR family)
MNFNNKNPIYMQIIEKIKNDISAGKLKAGDKLPSVRQMSEDLKVNPNTILRTFRELETLGITYTQRGMGTFITEDEKKMREIQQSAIDILVKNYINLMAKKQH